MKLVQTRIALVVAVLVATTSGCGVVNRIRAKNQLNEAARAYREGHFDEAEQHSREAARLDPNNKTAPMFVARTIHAQYRRGVQTPENIAKAILKKLNSIRAKPLAWILTTRPRQCS